MTVETLALQVRTLEMQLQILKAQIQQLKPQAPTKTTADLFGALSQHGTFTDEEIDKVLCRMRPGWDEEACLRSRTAIL